MKTSIITLVVVFLLSSTISAQTVSNETLKQRIQSTGASKAITVDFGTESNTTKVMAVSSNFAKDDVSRSGIKAMNFAIGFFYPGNTLAKTPDNYLFTFWVLTERPRFSEDHSFNVTLPDEMLVIGTARYAAKPRENMEYLNFEISRENLTKIASRSDVKFLLGDFEFRFTREQMKLLGDLLVVTEVK